MGLHCFKKHVLSTNFCRDIKEDQINFSIEREYGRHKKKSNFDYPKTMNILTCKESKFSNLSHH